MTVEVLSSSSQEFEFDYEERINSFDWDMVPWDYTGQEIDQPFLDDSIYYFDATYWPVPDNVQDLWTSIDNTWTYQMTSTASSTMHDLTNERESHYTLTSPEHGQHHERDQQSNLSGTQDSETVNAPTPADSVVFLREVFKVGTDSPRLKSKKRKRPVCSPSAKKRKRASYDFEEAESLFEEVCFRVQRVYSEKENIRYAWDRRTNRWNEVESGKEKVFDDNCLRDLVVDAKPLGRCLFELRWDHTTQQFKGSNKMGRIMAVDLHSMRSGICNGESIIALSMYAEQ